MTPSEKQTPAGILSALRSRRIVVEEFRPFAESLDWLLGQQYYRQKGRQAFLGREVPFLVTNDGFLSTIASEVLFQSLVEAEKGGALDGRSEIVVLELGVGLGLFSRFLLDAFQEICTRHGKNYYDRVCYIASDAAPRTIEELSQSGLLQRHMARYRPTVLDARQLGSRGLPEQEFRAVFANYLLDCLPAAILRFDASEVRQLCVRTSLSESDLQMHAGWNLAQLRALVESGELSRRADLIDVYDLFSLEYEFRPVEWGVFPYREQALELAAGGTCGLHSYGALACLEELWPRLAPGGFIMMSDYGYSGGEFSPSGSAYQRYGGSTQIGVNFSELRSYFSRCSGCEWTEPAEENPHIHVRLLSAGSSPEAASAFRKAASKPSFEWKDSPIEKARSFMNEGRRQAGLDVYLEAVRRQPYNWALLGEIARCLLTQREHEAAWEMADRAVSLNPLDPDLWNLLGDAQFAMGNHEEARRAFERALLLSPGDARSRLNLVYTLVRSNDLPAALRMIAEGLIHDREGDYQQRLLERQSEIVGELARRRQRRQMLLADRVAGPGPFSDYQTKPPG